ncbi:MAG: recombinase RecT [Moheibacter sp.]
MTTKNEVQKSELTHSERFTQAVTKEYLSKNKGVELTAFQTKLIQNYFMKIDEILSDSEGKRLKKSEQYREPLAYTWANVNIPKLAMDVVAFSSVGLDPMQPNHINPIPYKDNANNKYDITFIMGYNGIELKARKYGLDVPDDIICELVYSTDKFKQYKKDRNNEIESYDFEVVDDFDRGEIIGGFYYKVFNDNPEKNKLRVFSLRDLEKRKPKYASVEFYGGEKTAWKDGKPAGKEVVEGWADEMHLKNIKRAAWNSIIIDSKLIDDTLRAMLDTEAKAEIALQNEVDDNANAKVLDFNKVENVDITHLQDKEPEPVKVNEPEAEEATGQEEMNVQTEDAPKF